MDNPTISIDVTNLRLFDNTRLSDYKRCPRFFFFRHVLHWQPNGRKHPLVFGGAWHAGMDEIWRGVKQRLRDSTILSNAYDAFIEYWVNEGYPHPNEMDLSSLDEYGARTPGNARDKLAGYLKKRKQFIMSCDVLEIERAFAVPLDPEDDKLFYIGRIDKIVKMSDKHVRGIEHKTTTLMRLAGADRKQHKIGPAFLDSFSPNSQVDGYIASLRILYPWAEKVDIFVDGTLVHKVGEDFQFVPIDRQPAQIDQWLWETHKWIDEIDRDHGLLEEASESDSYLAAFPKNTNSCFDFNTSCPFISLCKARANPLTWGDDTPTGYSVKKWDPLEHIGTPAELAK